MISDLQELYQEVILDHNKNPRNFRPLPEANRRAEGHNPLCGDYVTIFLHLDGDVIRDISFQGSGCAISKASASMMTASLKGKSRAEAEELFGRFHRMVTGEPGPDEDPLDIGRLAAFAGVCEFPVRVKCASLAWHTMSAALEGRDEPVTTE